MEHRKRYVLQHKFKLSTQTKIAMLQQKGITDKPVVSGRDIITALALAAISNASKYDAGVALKEQQQSVHQF